MLEFFLMFIPIVVFFAVAKKTVKKYTKNISFESSKLIYVLKRTFVGLGEAPRVSIGFYSFFVCLISR
ncbi:hypothetical protein [Campylobacter geochelonis]|uniref:Uncharacterized protein n=1 Tax=Campylobacter geochelonis TaxID=1780362 RepID=A0A128EM09_9BACT|nr:hypothetical protein [Campylobacter geochelonis]QKF71476.1 hypothetical protein CGEO_1176 [Campylobacter geochelonis]QKF71479.1 hypothetical protein CGEO_1181 [Campylobacter geochelonis]CZE49492.1 Uncharacterised protein [Campylobacter geochelonis]